MTELLTDTPAYKSFFNGLIEAIEFTEECDLSEILPRDREILNAFALSFFVKAHPFFLVDDSSNGYGQLGYDLWLTSQGHGAGFWDGDWGKFGGLLTELSKTMPEEFNHCYFDREY